VTGIGNIGKAWDVFHDPEASPAEKADALIRSTPLNVGYAPERGLLEATGAKAETPAPLEEQAHAAGNVASLGLLGMKPMTALRVVRGGVGKLLGPALARVISPITASVATPARAARGLLNPRVVQALKTRIAEPLGGPLDDLVKAERDFAAGKLTAHEYRTAVDVADAQIRAADRPVQTVPAPVMEPLLPQLRGTPDPLTVPPRLRPLQALSTGKTLPYYPRGGQVEQAIPPPPQVSPIGPRFPRAGHGLFHALEDNPLIARRLTNPELRAALRFGRGTPEIGRELLALLEAEAQRRAGGLLQALGQAGGLLAQ